MSVLQVNCVNGSPTQTAENQEQCLQLLEKSGLKIVHQNIRSLDKNFTKFKKSVLDRADFDVIILSECHLQNYIPVSLNNHLVRSGMKNLQTENDGVVIYAKKTLAPKFEEREINGANSLSTFFGKIYILGIYRGPSKNESDFCAALDKTLADIREDHKNIENIFILGDINMDLLKIKPKVYTTRRTSYLQVIERHKLITGLKEPTRKDPTHGTESCHDHIMAITQLSFQPIIYNFEITDHYTTMLIIKINSEECGTLPTSEMPETNTSIDTPQQYETQLIQQCNTPDELHHVLNKILGVQTQKITFIQKPKNIQIISQLAQRIRESIDNNNNITRFDSTSIEESDIVMLRPFIDDIKNRILYFTDEDTIKHITENVNECISGNKLSRNCKYGIAEKDIVAMSKLVILNKLIYHIIHNKLVSNNQYCFNNETRLTNVLTPLIEISTEQIDARESCLAVIINFNNTMVDCAKMKGKYLERMKSPKYKFNDKEMNLFEKYAFNRNAEISELDNLSYTLFILYINDLCDLVEEGRVIAYGTELIMIFQAKTWKKTFEKAEKQLIPIKEWLSNNLEHYKMTNIKYVTFSNTRGGQPLNYKKIHKCINSHCIYKSIKHCDHLYYCGVMIDQHLKWGSQIKVIVKQITHLKSLVGKIANMLEKSEVNDITKRFSQWILGYGIIGWGNACKTQMNKIVREAKKIPDSNILQDIYELYVREILQYIIHKNKPSNDGEMTLPTMDTTYGQRSILYTGVQLYNKLPVRLREMNLPEPDLSEWIQDDGIHLLTDLIKKKSASKNL